MTGVYRDDLGPPLALYPQRVQDLHHVRLVDDVPVLQPGDLRPRLPDLLRDLLMGQPAVARCLPRCSRPLRWCPADDERQLAAIGRAEPGHDTLVGSGAVLYTAEPVLRQQHAFAHLQRRIPAPAVCVLADLDDLVPADVVDARCVIEDLRW